MTIGLKNSLRRASDNDARIGHWRRALPRFECLESRDVLSGGLIPTSLDLGAYPEPIYGESFLLQADLREAASGPTRPVGDLVFTVDGVAQAPIVVNSFDIGVFTFTPTLPLAPGPHVYTVSYSGDGTYAPSSAAAANAVQPVPAVVQLTAAPSAAPAGGAVTLDASVSAALPNGRSLSIPTPPITGTVTFRDGSTVLQQVPLGPTGHASFTTTALGVGSHAITATYSGNTDVAPAMSNAVAETVAPPDEGPLVTTVQRFGFHAQPTLVVIGFDKALDPASAQDVGNYAIVRLDRRGRPVGPPVTLAAATYDPVADTVTLRTSHRLNVQALYRLTISGVAPKGVKDAGGVGLAGTGAGHPGTNYTTTISWFSSGGQS